MQQTVPLVSISVLQPFVSPLRAAGVNPKGPLALLGFSGEPSAHPETLVHTNLVNRFLDACVEVTKDQQFCSRIGSTLDPEGWPMIYTALESATSLAEFISIYIDGANRVATSVDTYMEVRGTTATFGQHRITKPDTLPGQNDAFMASLYVAMIRKACGGIFDPKAMTVMVCDPSALAEEVAQCHVLRGDAMGHKVQFPTLWLSTNAMRAHSARQAEIQRKDLLSTLRVQLQQNIGKGDIKAADVARMCGLSLSRLKRALARQDTSITKELDRAKLDYAREHLAHGSLAVHDIATALGYADASNFARWFRAATGQSPTKYRDVSTKTKPKGSE